MNNPTLLQNDLTCIQQLVQEYMFKRLLKMLNITRGIAEEGYCSQVVETDYAYTK